MSLPVQFVQTSKKFESALSQLREADEIAIDLEFDKNFYRYGFNLCLVQIFDGEHCFLIDPLSRNINIEDLFPILEDNKIQKVCFSFDEDLRLLHSLGCIPKNLYDLGIVSRLLNYPAASLTNLLEEVLGVDTGSSSQQSNWYKRPLSKNQKVYAANDVLHLLDLKQAFQKEAGKNGVKAWIEQENEYLNHLDYRGIEHNEIIREKDMNGFTELEWHRFKKLVYWRDDKGREYNKPPFQIVNTDVLSAIAKDSRKLMNWETSGNIFRKIKTENVKDELIRLMKEANEEADRLNLSDLKPAKKPLSGEEHKIMMSEKREINKVKQTIFKPIKERIEEEHGAEIASYLLSNRIIDEMITGTNGSIPEYKKNLILKIAEELELQIDSIKKYIAKNS